MSEKLRLRTALPVARDLHTIAFANLFSGL
jgi:hypothetical protein